MTAKLPVLLFLSILLPFPTGALFADAGASRAFAPRDNYGALLEPRDGIYTGAGQDPSGYEGYVKALGPGNAPVIYMFYTGLKANLEGDFRRLAREMADAEAKHGSYGIAQIGLSMTTDGSPSKHYEQDVAAGLYDDAIESLCRGIRDLGYPVILRIGYEFNGAAWNGYGPDSYKAAFIRITKRIREYGLECATCWDASAVKGTMAAVYDYYPGDEWVDWWGINLFNAEELRDRSVERFMVAARSRKKPVLIGESTPKNVGVLKGNASWNAWFEPYFSFIREHPGVKAFSYINWDWSRYPQWSDWGDARLEMNADVARQFSAEIARSPYCLGREEKDLRRLFGDAGDAVSKAIPSPVTGLAATARTGGVALSWNGDPSIRRWTVLREGVPVGTTGTNSFFDRSVAAGETARYSAIAHSRNGLESKSCPGVAITMPSAIEKALNGDFGAGISPWSLNLYSGGDASATIDTTDALGAGSCAKVRIAKGSTNWFVQLSQGVASRAGSSYTLTVTAKADRPCSVDAMLQQAHEPYGAILNRRLELDTTPRTFTVRNAGTATDDLLNLTFMMGGNAGRTVWIDEVSLMETK